MNYVMDLRKLVGNTPLILTGAVVLVLNGNNELLLQHRSDGGWGLPGGLMELGETLEGTARREVKEETGLGIGELELLNVFSEPEYYLKLANGDKLYSVTAVYLTNDFKGNLEIDRTESVDLRYFSINELPEGLNKGARNYMEPYFKRLKE